MNEVNLGKVEVRAHMDGSGVTGCTVLLKSMPSTDLGVEAFHVLLEKLHLELGVKADVKVGQPTPSSEPPELPMPPRVAFAPMTGAVQEEFFIGRKVNGGMTIKELFGAPPA